MTKAMPLHGIYEQPGCNDYERGENEKLAKERRLMEDNPLFQMGQQNQNPSQVRPNTHNEGIPDISTSRKVYKGDTVWRFNPNSDYNKMNTRQDASNHLMSDQKRQYYEDQRMFYMHRKALAENIEKARRADPEKEKTVEQSERIRQEAAERRVANRKQYMLMQAAKAKARVVKGIDEDEIFIREGK